MEARTYPPLKSGYYGVAVMTLAQVFAFIDRQIPAMLIEPIKMDFGLSDSQIALLGGGCFLYLLCRNGSSYRICSRSNK